MSNHIDTLITALADALDMSHSTRYRPGKIGQRSNPQFVRIAAAAGVPRKELAAMIGCSTQAIGDCVLHKTYKDKS